MEILEAYDLTRCAHSAAQLAGCDEKTVTRYVAVRDAGRDPLARPRRPRSIDPFWEKIEELVDKSQGKVRADIVPSGWWRWALAAPTVPPAGRWRR